MKFWNQVTEEELLKHKSENDVVVDVNAHLHTPFSFSAFNSIEQVFELAGIEGINVLGINDFFTTKGYSEWAENSLKNKVCPLFNIEFIALSKADQEKGIRINDPNNPGRIYISGKGMMFPFKLDEPYASNLAMVQDKSNLQSKAMVDALNNHLAKVGVDIKISYNDILANDTKGMVRERHLAKKLRALVFEKEKSAEGRRTLLEAIFGGKAVKADINDNAALENEIRGNLLKAGGAAFVEESPELFLDLETVRQLILNGGGIPTYPLLADSVNGGFTEFEVDKVKLLDDIKSKGFYSVEFIPNRNTTAVLEEYSAFFIENGIAVSFGSEHNSPDLFPIIVKAKEGVFLSDYLKKVNYEGACLIIAHQYLVANGKEGFLQKNGEPNLLKRNELIEKGKALINYFTTK